MLNSKKGEYLEHAKDLARNLETVTNAFIEIQIGWMENDWEDIPVTIMINHETSWFGSFEIRWNENILFHDIKRFKPVKEDYLILNELIDRVYNPK